MIKLGPSVKIGYYAQQHETLHPDWTLVQEIRDAKPMYETDAVAILQRFLFDYYAAQKQVRHLSGGERSRLQLAKLMLSDVNFLMLDEPTNNLDIPSSEVLESRARGVQRHRAGHLARPLLPGPHCGSGRCARGRGCARDCGRLLGLRGTIIVGYLNSTRTLNWLSNHLCLFLTGQALLLVIRSGYERHRQPVAFEG